MKPFVMGTEVEYSVSGQDRNGPVLPENLYALLRGAVRKESATLPDSGMGPGLFLENAGRLYLDCGGHPEYATPECFTPAQVACYDKAGEQLLSTAAAAVRRAEPSLRLSVVKNNIGPVHPDEVTWGNHESYTCWVPLEQAVAPLLPHLVSRVLYAGAGYLSTQAPDVGIELSQRARHLVEVTGPKTTEGRALFCTRLRKENDLSPEGWTRAHLIAKDSQRAPFGIYLTFGSTALIFLCLNEQRPVGKGLALAAPLAALRAISRDAWLRVRVPLADGRRLTALEIQEVYLADCERAVQAGNFPAWAGEVLRHWRETLAALAQDPLRLARRLDPYTKLLVYSHELRRAGYPWADLRHALDVLSRLRQCFPLEVIRALLAEEPKALPPTTQPAYQDAVRQAEANRPGQLDRLRFAVRLQALDLNYHELGGLYDQLAAAGQVESVVLGPTETARALREPPPGGRAAARAEWIKARTREGGWICDWRFLYQRATGTYVDLGGPFSVNAQSRHIGEALPEDLPLELFARFVRLQGR